MTDVFGEISTLQDKYKEYSAELRSVKREYIQLQAAIIESQQRQREHRSTLADNANIHHDLQQYTDVVDDLSAFDVAMEQLDSERTELHREIDLLRRQRHSLM
jgi:chromosome segregation ATPase